MFQNSYNLLSNLANNKEIVNDFFSKFEENLGENNIFRTIQRLKEKEVSLLSQTRKNIKKTKDYWCIKGEFIMLEIDLRTVNEQTKIKYKQFTEQVMALLHKYEEQDPIRLQQVKTKLEETKGNWDIGIGLRQDDKVVEEIPVSLLLAYEYCLATEKITAKEVEFGDMLDKLFNGVQKFRIGNPVLGMDDECLYGKSFDDPTAIPVTTKQYRIKMHAGAQHLDYFKDGMFTGAVFIFAKENIPNFSIDQNTGKSKSFETDGINFQELSDEMSLLTCFRQTAFHEWNHNAEKEVIQRNAQAIKEEYDSVDGKKYRNYETINQYVSSEGITIQEPKYFYEKYQKPNGKTEDRYYYIDSTGNKQYDMDFGLITHPVSKYCFSSGMTTREVMQNGETKIHNQITEGFVEATARAMILAIAPNTMDIDEGRYYEQVEMAKRVISSRDKSMGKRGITYAEFLMQSSRLKSDLESREVDGKVDGLHYISDFADMVYDKMTPKKKLYMSMGHIVTRLGIKVDEQVKKAFEKLNLFGKSSISEQEKNIFKNLLMSGQTPDEDYVDGIITELVTYIDDENKFFDGIPEKLGYKEKDKSKYQLAERGKYVTGRKLGSQVIDKIQDMNIFAS